MKICACFARCCSVAKTDRTPRPEDDEGDRERRRRRRQRRKERIARDASGEQQVGSLSAGQRKQYNELFGYTDGEFNLSADEATREARDDELEAGDEDEELEAREARLKLAAERRCVRAWGGSEAR
jgi:hypothetical protein